jgi:hypothetical protein
MAQKFNIADFLHKNSWFSGSEMWNVLMFGNVILLTLFYCKKNCCQSLKLKMAAVL